MDNKEKNFISAVIYVHNAEKRIQDFLKMIIEIMEHNFMYSEIICVNDSSDDRSVEIIKQISKIALSTSISVVNMSYYHGLELSMNAGVDLAIGDFVFEFDKTLIDFDREEIMKTYYKALQGYDIVSESPDKKPQFRSGIFYKILNKHTATSGRISSESFRIISRRAINRIHSKNNTIPYRKIIYANCGLKNGRLNYKVINPTSDLLTDQKEAKYKITLAIDSLIMFTDIGYRFAVTMTLLMMFISLFVIIYSTIVYFTSNPVAGWTTIILFLSFVFFGLFGILTIIIKYLQLLIDLVFKRKHYTFESIEKLTR